jgi:phosphoglycolate phosphatase-like HAD superfamily hydrolase
VPSRQLLVCDLDNTLYDWLAYFVPSFYAMVDTAVQITGCDREQLLDDLRKVHQAHGDSEHPFALLETETIRSIFGDRSLNSIAAVMDPAFHAFNSTRKNTLRLHPHVCETLTALKESGVKLVAHTESKLYGAVDRLSRLDLFKFFSRIYCRERPASTHPTLGRGIEWLQRFPMEKITELSTHQMKPDPAVLLEICAAEGILPRDAAYVGDSVARDMLMAQRANVFAIWAAYGAHHDPATYDALVRISHWTTEEVEREISLRNEAKSVRPDLVARESFAEILTAFNLDDVGPRRDALSNK